MSYMINYTNTRVFLTPTRIRSTLQQCPLILPDGRERSLARTITRFRHIKRRQLMIQNSIGYLMCQETYHAVTWRTN